MNSANSFASPARGIVLVIRGLSPAMIGAYGNEWIHTPTLDRLATRGITYDMHFAGDLLDTSPSLKSLDLLPATVRRFANVPHSSRDRHALFAIRREVYEWMDSLDQKEAALAIVDSAAILPPWQPPKRNLTYYFGQPADEAPTPWNGPLPRHISPDDDQSLERLQDTHAAVISEFDRGLSRFLAGCRRRDFGANALIAVTSDRAFPLGEQGPVGDGARSVIESVAHLPLIVRLPFNALAGMRIAALTQSQDLAELVSGHFAGVNWSPPPKRDHIVIRCGDESALRTNDRMLVSPLDGEPRLYMKPEDRWEYANVASEREGEVEALMNVLGSD